MSMEEDTELRDLISQTLEANGCFSKIRAQLRASIYLALDEDDAFQKKEFLPNKKLHSSLETNEGKLMFCIVREFLEQFDLEFTISVFEPESHMGSSYEYLGRQKLIQGLSIPNLKQESSDPILLQLIQLCKLNSKFVSSENIDDSVSSLNCKNDLISQTSYNENNDIIMAAENSDMSDKFAFSDPDLLNETFCVARENILKTNLESSLLFKVDKVEDICKNTKSQLDLILPEDLVIDADKSDRTENVLKSDHIKSKYTVDQCGIETEFSPPIVKDLKHTKVDSSFDKLKLSSPKSEKIKTKNNLGSLPDTSTIQISKSRTNDMLLPSLYTREFKDKGNVKDVDKLFDLEPMDNYEEDFISESEIDIAIHKTDNTNADLLSQRKEVERDEISDNFTKQSSLSNEYNLSNKKKPSLDGNSTASSVTSEDFEINSNMDDLMNSC
ncbi:fgfr1 oncogene partner/lish domain-containing protein [Holotrichia oblita]|uniref:Fgfr1 oncogene partner/lish domain-containing protein n=1 Tax=Holotrichia oblita TaxID=644536 RepID=A0ACB9TV04_HOLOL|nr:fgfr1 oncogene partner/lish domain-containing protein [Holotrichia oblita]